MDKEYFLFSLFVIWYFNNYGVPGNLLFFISKLNKVYNYVVYLSYKNVENKTLENKEIVEENTQIIPELKYEDKYLSDLIKMDKEFKFNEKENKIKMKKMIEFLEIIKNEGNKKISEIIKQDEEQAEEQAKNFIINERLDNLKNCYAIETTPLGNVMMTYDNIRSTFQYYSDNSIPYRYLEVVARKYVKQFDCRPIYIYMDEEIKIAEEKWNKEIKEKEEKEKIKKENALKNNKPNLEKKNVFAKFKSYNKEAGTGHVNIAVPPKNSIPNKSLTAKQENEKILLKEKANRYTYDGKFANFLFIKKVDRKVIDKKFCLSFSDFKKMKK